MSKKKKIKDASEFIVGKHYLMVYDKVDSDEYATLIDLEGSSIVFEFITISGYNSEKGAHVCVLILMDNDSDINRRYPIGEEIIISPFGTSDCIKEISVYEI
jgi:hypoxanthine-guanine phosphoribosyltransferase